MSDPVQRYKREMMRLQKENAELRAEIARMNGQQARQVEQMQGKRRRSARERHIHQ